MPWAKPTPITAPTRVWVVEMGRPRRRGDQHGGGGAELGAEAAGGGHLRDLLADRRDDLVAPGGEPHHDAGAAEHQHPHRHGHLAAAARRSRCRRCSPPRRAGPTALATSLAPWAKATKMAVITCSQPKTAPRRRTGWAALRAVRRSSCAVIRPASAPTRARAAPQERTTGGSCTTFLSALKMKESTRITRHQSPPGRAPPAGPPRRVAAAQDGDADEGEHQARR